MLAWLPSYLISTLEVDLMHAAQTALLPPLAGIAASNVAGRLADGLIARGASVPLVRKLAQCTAFLLPSALLTVLATSDDAASSPELAVGLLTASLAFSQFSLAGLYCTHADLSLKFSPTLLGLTNTVGALPGIIGVSLVGFLLDCTDRNWNAALIAPSAALLVAGALVYTVSGRNDPVDFENGDNSPFLWERRLSGLFRRLRMPFWQEQGGKETSSL
jgi:ACS family sodium-dependent inorganic phosphate cotransporter